MKTTVIQEYETVRHAPRNLQEADRHLFSNEFNKRIEACVVEQLCNIHIVNDLLVDLKHMRIYERASHLHPISVYAKFRRVMLLRKKTTHITQGVWVCDNWSEGYFHWLTDVLPRILASEPLARDAPILLPNHFVKLPYVLPALEILGHKPHFFDPANNNRIDVLTLPHHTASTGNYQPKLINELRDRMVRNKVGAATRKVYVSRAKAPKRSIQNETEVQEVMRSFGYEIHYFEDYDLLAQIKLLSETNHLVGLHGAGLTNMLFMPAPGKVMELRNKHENHNNCFFSLAGELGHNYYYQLCDGDSTLTHRINVHVDLDLLQRNLTMMEMG